MKYRTIKAPAEIGTISLSDAMMALRESGTGNIISFSSGGRTVTRRYAKSSSTKVGGYKGFAFKRATLKKASKQSAKRGK